MIHLPSLLYKLQLLVLIAAMKLQLLKVVGHAALLPVSADLHLHEYIES